MVGYLRVSTDEQDVAAQRTAIEEAAGRRGWVVVAILADDGISGKSMTNRPKLRSAMRRIEKGGADALVVAKIDRLSRSVSDFCTLLERARKKRWSVIVLDMELDMTTPIGEMVAGVLMQFAQFERRLIGQRTKDALAQKKAEGVILGRPRTVPDRVVDRIRRERQAGVSLEGIAASLTADAIPTAHGGLRWYGSTVKAILARAAA